jgi:hypothetical protein
MLPSEYTYMLETKKFTDIQLVSEIPCPNQAPCFYFVKLKYIPNIHQVLENEIIERRKLLESTVFINEKPAKVQYSRLDINEIQQAFDKNEQTVIRTLESNPLIIQLFFEKPRNFSQITLFVGGSPTQATVSLKSTQTASSIKLSKSVMDSNQKQEIIINFEKKDMFDIMIIEILSVNDDDLAHVHLWEVKIE